MKRTIRVLVALVAVQAALIGMYWLVERHRMQDTADRDALGVEPPMRVAAPMPRLVLRSLNGTPVDVHALERPTLVHFWATWCPPCRAELPGLLALPNERPVDVLAVALDEDPTHVKRFLAGRSASAVLLGDAEEAERVLGVRTLPVTFLVQPGGHIDLRFDGARNWADEDFLKTWIGGVCLDKTLSAPKNSWIYSPRSFRPAVPSSHFLGLAGKTCREAVNLRV